MSSLLTSQGVVFATAMAVSAGTMILLATFRLQKSQEFSFNSISDHPPRSCIYTDGKKEKKKKKVKFAEDVVEPSGNSEEYRKLHHFNNNNSNNYFRHENKNDEALSSFSNSNSYELQKSGKMQAMPANRVALYIAMLKGRVVNRVTYSY